MSDDAKPTLWHQSGINREGAPFIQLLLGTEVVCQMDPQEAREHAMAVLESAEAAEQDAFIFDWVKKHIGAGDAQAVGLLTDFREWRANTTGKRGGPTRPTDWVMPPKI